MRTWNLTTQDPLNLVISADQALGIVDPMDDQIWEVAPGQGDPPAMAVRTSFGRRAVEMRYFPVFMRGNERIINPREFFYPPTLKKMFSNYLEFTFSPLEGVDVIMEYWVPSSKILAGRIAMTYREPTAGRLQVDWIGQLLPNGEGEVMIPETMNMNFILAGKCADLSPVCFISGGSTIGTSIYPGLSLEINPRKTTQQVFTWASAALLEKEQSYNAARNTTFRSWEAEISRVEITNESRMLEIHTGNLEWDAVLSASQKTAHSLVMPAGNALKNETFVRSRTVEEGYSARGDGRDHGPGWSGQNTLDSDFLARLLLPEGAEMLRGILLNFLDNQHRNGKVDWSLGMGGQRSQVNAQPVLAQLALKLAPQFPDREWLRLTLPQLNRFFISWFEPDLDRDQDGFPEWRTSGQSGLEHQEIPWMDYLESPGLAAFLLNESEAIREISEILGETPDIQVEKYQFGLEKALQECWDEKAGIFGYRDYETHLKTSQKVILNFEGGGLYPVKTKFESPQRLIIRIQSNQALKKPFAISLKGRSEGKAVSISIKSWDFRRQPGQAVHATRITFSQLDQVRANGLGPEDELFLETCDSSMIDVSLLLPLTTKAVTKTQVETLIQDTIPAWFLSTGGLRYGQDDESIAPVQYTAYLVEGLLDHGDTASAVQIMTSMLDHLVCKLNNRSDPALNSLENTIPISTFLRLCGIESLTREELILNGFNLFSQVVRMSYRGTVLMLHSNKSDVLLNQQEPIEITNPERIRIPLRHHVERS